MIKSTIFGHINPVLMQTSFLLSFFLFIFACVSVNGQYTETINSNRPGASQGAFSVGKNVIQIESGLGIGKESHSVFDNESKTTEFEYNFRIGLVKEQLEFNIEGSYLSIKTNDIVGNSDEDFVRKGFPFNVIGAKYLIYDPYKYGTKKNFLSWKANNRFSWNKLKPAVAAFLGANFRSSNSDFAFQNNPDNRATEEQSGISPKLAIIAQNNWSEEFVFVINVVLDRLTTEFPDKRFIFTTTYNYNERLSFFGEYEHANSKIYIDNLLKAGATYVINKDFKIDAHILGNFKDTPKRAVCNFGISYRLDYHKSSDDEKIDTAEYHEVKKDVKQIKKDIEAGLLDPSVMQGKYKGYDLEEFVEEKVLDEIIDEEFDGEKNTEEDTVQPKWWQLGKKRKKRRKLKETLSDTTNTSIETKPALGTTGRRTDFADSDFIKNKQLEVTPGERSDEELLAIEERNNAKKNKRGLFGKRRNKDNEPLIDTATGDTIPAPDYSGMSRKEIKAAKKQEKELRSLLNDISDFERDIEAEKNARDAQKAAKKKAKAAKKAAKKKAKSAKKGDEVSNLDDEIEALEREIEKEKKENKPKQNIKQEKVDDDFFKQNSKKDSDSNEKKNDKKSRKELKRKEKEAKKKAKKKKENDDLIIDDNN